MAWTGIWRGASDVDGQSGWDDDHANKMLYMAPTRIMWVGDHSTSSDRTPSRIGCDGVFFCQEKAPRRH